METAIAEEAAEGNALAREGNRLAAEANDLQAIANRYSAQANAKLAAIGANGQRTNEILDRAVEQARKGNEALNELVKREGETNRLLEQQSGQIDAVRDAIGGLTDAVERQTLQLQMQLFAQWKQTGDGRAYMEWAGNAENSLSWMRYYTARMNGARELDVRMNAALLVAQVESEAPSTVADGPKPEFAQKPPKRLSVAVPPSPGGFDEREPMSRASASGTFVFGVTVAVGLGLGVFKAFTTHIPTHASGILDSIMHFVILVFNLLWMSLAGAVVGALAGVVLGGIVAGIVSILPGNKAKRAAWERRRAEHEAAQSRHDEAAAEQRRADEDYERRLDEYQRNRASYEASWGREVAARNWKREEMERSRAQRLAGCGDRALGMVAPPTAWSAGDTLALARELGNVIATAQMVQQVPDPLPDWHLYAFAQVDSIPESSPHMRAELAALREEFMSKPMQAGV